MHCAVAEVLDDSSDDSWSSGRSIWDRPAPPPFRNAPAIALGPPEALLPVRFEELDFEERMRQVRRRSGGGRGRRRQAQTT